MKANLQEIKQEIMSQMWDICCHNVTEEDCIREANATESYFLDMYKGNKEVRRAIKEVRQELEV